MHRYQVDSGQSMKGSEFRFDYVDGLHCKYYKRSLNGGGFYIDSRQWLQNKEATINQKNKNDHIYLKYAVTPALNHEKNWKKSTKNIKD